MHFLLQQEQTTQAPTKCLQIFVVFRSLLQQPWQPAHGPFVESLPENRPCVRYQHLDEKQPFGTQETCFTNQIRTRSQHFLVSQSFTVFHGLFTVNHGLFTGFSRTFHAYRFSSCFAQVATVHSETHLCNKFTACKLCCLYEK